MALSSDLISQFVKVTNDNTKVKKEATTVYGTVVEDEGKKFVRIDGADTAIPAIPVDPGAATTVVDVQVGDRVIVTIKNHKATITSNLYDPSASSKKVYTNEAEVSEKITELDIAIANRVTTDQLNAANANITNELVAKDAVIREELTASIVNVEEKLTAKDVEISGKVTANEGEITNLKTNKLSTEDARLTYATIKNLEATNANVNNLSATHATFENATAENFKAVNATVSGKLDAETAKITYANIDFSNIGQVAMEYFYANSGLIENVVVSDGAITGTLVGVTIKGDIIEGGTVVADKLVIQGEDGLYYKLNTDGVTTEAEQTEYNSLNGSVIAAKSITATQISVDDLVAFDATIGGFNITDTSIYSEVKDSEGNTTRGIYMDTDGQVNFGDESNFIKYYYDEDADEYKLVISASSILYALNGKQHSISDLGLLGEYVRITTYEGEPCIELGENDSDFRLIITNTRIQFMEGSSVPAHINNQSMHITKAVIEEEIQQGEFVWKVRANGNMGLMWKGGQ